MKNAETDGVFREKTENFVRNFRSLKIETYKLAVLKDANSVLNATNLGEKA